MAKKQKRSGSKILIIGLIAAGLIFYVYRQAMKISITGGFFRVHKLVGTNVELRVFLQITNEGNGAVDVQNFLGQLLYQNSNVGIVQLFQPVTIPPFSVKEVEFVATVSGLAAATQLYNILINKAQFDPQSMRIKGTLRAENLNIDINEALLSA